MRAREVGESLEDFGDAVAVVLAVGVFALALFCGYCVWSLVASFSGPARRALR